MLCRRLKTHARDHRDRVLQELFKADFDFACLGEHGDWDRVYDTRFARLVDRLRNLDDTVLFWYRLQFCLKGMWMTFHTAA